MEKPENWTYKGSDGLVSLVEFLIKMRDRQKLDPPRTTEPNSRMTVLDEDGNEIIL